MAKSIFKILLSIFILLVVLGWYFFFSSTTRFAEKSKFFYIHTNQTDRNTILNNLDKEGIVKNIKAFDMLARQRGY